MLVLSGKKVAEKKRAEIKKRVSEFTRLRGRPPGLAVVIVGEDPASQVYVRNKMLACEETGIRSFHHALKKETTMPELLKLISGLNESPDVDGILVQLPLPDHLDRDLVVGAISPLKDPDGLTTENLGLLLAGRPRVVPCTPLGVMEIFKHYDIDVKGKHAVVVGRSQIVGRPMAQLLMIADATVTMCHSRTKDLRQFTKEADIVVVAAGKPRFLGVEDFKSDAVVIDVGMHRLFDGLCGDVRYEEIRNHVQAATPVPGGVGPMTITMLLENTLRLAELAREA